MNIGKTKLSKSILDMKFMKRTKDKVEQQQFQEEGEEYFENKITQRMKKDSERFIVEPSYVFCERLIDGRLSFRGMNPDIEKLMEKEKMQERLELEMKKETDISDEQMVMRWKSSWKNMRPELNSKALVKKDVSINKRPKFWKPSD
ncbi:hypothetical protein KM043_017687 [Ampulex compressa]|nr:hypothetical protein KM043_017687 [Ampulex compressa]